MHKFGITLVFFYFFLSSLYAQEADTKQVDTEADSLKTTLRSNGVIVQDSLFMKKKILDPLAPSRAAFYSAILPGLGQVYNKRYWKVPIVWGVIGGSVYLYDFNNKQYDRFRTAFKRRRAGFTDDEFNGEGVFPFFDVDRLENQQERFQRDRDLWLVISIGMYALNIIDANVDSHLKQFNIDNDLSLDFQPFLDLNQVTNDPTYGMALTIKF